MAITTESFDRLRQLVTDYGEVMVAERIGSREESADLEKDLEQFESDISELERMFMRIAQYAR